jgi:hypothetical protein
MGDEEIWKLLQLGCNYWYDKALTGTIGAE